MKCLVILTFFLFISKSVADFIQLEKQVTKKDWWESALFYQIYVLSFKDSDGDGIGDLRGIIEELGHLKDMDVTAICLSSIFKSPMVDFGYDVSDFREIDPVFGTIADLEELLQKAKDYGFKIILDVVPNHTSNKSAWFEKSVKRIAPYTDYYVWHDGKLNALSTGERFPPNNWQSEFYGSAWAWNAERQQFYYHSFAKEQPDLNYRNPKVVDEIKEVLRFWMEKGVNGFRVNAIPHLFEFEDLRNEPLTGLTADPNSYLYTHHHYTTDLDEMYDVVYQWREAIDKFQKDKMLNDSIILMTEAYTNTSTFVKFFNSKDGKRKGAQIPLNFILISDLDEYAFANAFKKFTDDRIRAVPVGTPMSWIMGNHDNSRVASRYGTQKIDGLLTLVMTLPGVAVIYYGEEIGMVDNRRGIFYNETLDPQACNLPRPANWREMSRDPQRTAFQWDDSKWAGFSKGNRKPWLPIHPNFRYLNLKTQKSSLRSTYKYFAQLSKLRKEPSFAYGLYKSKVLTGDVFAYARSWANEPTYVVLINFGAREESVDITALVDDFTDVSEVVVAGADTAYVTGTKLFTKRIFLRKYETVILKSAKPSSATIRSVSCFLLTLICLKIFL